MWERLPDILADFSQLTSASITFSLTGPLLGRNRVSHTVGVLGNDSHQVVSSWSQLSCCKGPLTCRNSFLEGSHRGHLCKAEDKFLQSECILSTSPCLLGTEKGILDFALPNFNLYSIYMKKIHSLDRFIHSLWAHVSLATHHWLWLLKLDLLLQPRLRQCSPSRVRNSAGVMCLLEYSDYFCNTWHNTLVFQIKKPVIFHETWWLVGQTIPCLLPGWRYSESRDF